MLVYNGKEYYPLELDEIQTCAGKKIYSRKNRDKPYIYLALSVFSEKEAKNE